MFGTRRLLLVVAPLALLWLAPPAGAAIKAKTSLTTKSGATRIVVKLKSSRRVSARSRPRAVSVKAGRRTYKLKRVRGARAAAVRLGTWRSRAYRRSAARKLLRQAGKRVRVRVRSRTGTRSLRSKLAPPRGTAPPGDVAPPGGVAPPGADQPGDITGQQAIDQLTAELRGGMVRRFRTSGDLSESFELHLCADGRFRYYHHQSYVGFGPVATERFGSPWTVVEALVRPDGSYRGARVRGTFTVENSFNSGQRAINEPAEALIEYQNGQWYWDKQAVQTGQASCDPTF
ncbi:MAG: hypothetical protein ACRDL4_12730 [Thermoleophilaceae bacterium]